MSPPIIYNSSKNKDIKINTSWAKKKIQSEAPRYNLKLQSSKSTKIFPYLHPYVLPLLWQIAKGQSRLIIKRRWRRWPSKTCQLCTQSLKLRENVHQKLTMSCLNGHESVQHTTNAIIIRNRRWRSSSTVGSTNASAAGSLEGGGGGATPEEESTLGRLELAHI